MIEIGEFLLGRKMGDMADYHRQGIAKQELEIWRELDSMCCVELLRTIEDVLNNPDYQKNNYTPMIQDIVTKCRVRKLKPSPKQAASIKTHLAYNSGLWY